MPLALLFLALLTLAPVSAGQVTRTDTTTPYSLGPAPFSGRMPAGWAAKKQSTQVTVFQAPPGTAEAETSVWIRVAPLVQRPDWAVEDYIEDVQRANAKLTNIQWGPVESQRSEGGRDMLILPGAWSNKTSAGAMTEWRAIFVFLMFPDYIVIGQYSAPQKYFDRLSGGFAVIWNSLAYGSSPARPDTAPPAGGRHTFTIESPPYVADMPPGWINRRSGEVVVIEGAPGTEPYEMTIRVSFYAKKQHTLAGMAASVRASLAGLPQATVTATTLTQTSEGRPARALLADYDGRDSANRPCPFRQLVAIVEHDAHLVVLSYGGPSALHDKYGGAFEMVGSSLRARP